MDTLNHLFAQHGLLAVALAVLLEQLGAPLPSTPVLLLAGVEAAHQAGFGAQAFAVATVAALAANGLWFWAGRRLGRRVLSTLCLISISPDSCVRQNEASFAHRGVLTLVLAKFVPGLSILAPPLAGALGMPMRRFLGWNLLGSALWAGVGIGGGWLFHAQIDAVLQALSRLGGVALALAGGALLLYLAWRFWRRARLKAELGRLERLAPQELAALIAQKQSVLVLDVRAPLPGVTMTRIPGARHFDLARPQDSPLADWPEGMELVTYCACPADASAAKAAQWLQQQGRRVRVLRGGIEAWHKAGLAVETA